MTSVTTAPPEAEDLPGVTRRHRPSDFYHERTNFQFIKHTRRWLIASSTLLVLSLLLLGVRGLNLGIDFKGGTAWQVPMAAGKTAKVADVRTAITRGKLKRQGRFVGRRSDWKKAYVTLRAGEKLPDFLEGA